MLKKKKIFSLLLVMLITSCDTWGSVKRGLTGQKQVSTDEFLVQKKDPLILPPDFDSLPTPGERQDAIEDKSTFEEKLKKLSSIEDDSSSTTSTEESILEQIQKQ